MVRRWLRERKIPGSNPAYAGIFFGVESYQWLKNWHSSGYPARRQALQGQRDDWLARCQYTVTGRGRKFDLQLLSRVAARKTVWADPSLRYTRMLLERSATISQWRVAWQFDHVKCPETNKCYKSLLPQYPSESWWMVQIICGIQHPVITYYRAFITRSFQHPLTMLQESYCLSLEQCLTTTLFSSHSLTYFGHMQPEMCHSVYWIKPQIGVWNKVTSILWCVVWVSLSNRWKVSESSTAMPFQSTQFTRI